MTSRSLLAIDDDPDICEVIAGAAAAKGLPCITTTDPAAFLNAINPATSLILVDLRMPNIDGIELLRQLGDRQCKASIVLISGVGSRILETARELAHAHGLPDVRHLQKPFRIAELETIIESHMLAAPTPVASPRKRAQWTTANCAKRSTATSSFCTISRRSTSRPAPSPAWRPWCAGSIRRKA
jgi:DNA-binding NtrC family response regulator